MSPENSTLGNRITDTNSNNFPQSDKNSPELLEEHKQKVSKVSLNSGTDTLEKSETDTFDTFSYSTLKSSGEFSSSEEKETEDEDIEIKDHEIIIKAKSKHKFEIYYGFAGTVVDTLYVI